MTRRNIFINDRIWAKLKTLADKDGLKIADLVRRAIAELLRREYQDD